MKTILTALKKAQGEFPPIQRGKTANVPTKSGGSYSYSYADLGDVVDGCQPVLSANDLVLFQVGAIVDGKQALRTILGHVCGETIQSDFLLPATDDYQDAGAGITYFRRYAQCAALGIVTEEDSDGQQKPKRPAGGEVKGSPLKEVPPPREMQSTKTVEELGAFVFQFGKYKGKRLDQIGQHDLDSWVGYMDGQGELSERAAEAVATANAYLAKVERKAK